MNWNGLTANSFWFDEHRLLFNRDSRAMADLPSEYVQMVVTSPPYWGLRKYAGLPDLIWDGDGSCEHNEMIPNSTKHDNLRFRGEHSIVGNEKNKEIHPVHSWSEEVRTGEIYDTKTGGAGSAVRQAGVVNKVSIPSSSCSLCGAWKGQLGLEPSPELYLAHLVEIFREVRRVLRKDGVCFVNIGDSYAGSNSGNGDYREKKGLQKDIYDYEHPQANAGRWDKWRRGVGGEEHGTSLSGIPRPLNLKPKDLCLIPFRLAIALQEDGWWCRSVIIWNKPNPMPESVTDRPTESHEYILMLTKSSRYYYDQEAVREAYTEPLNRWGGPEFRDSSHKYIELGGHDGEQHYGATSMFRKGRPVRPIETGRNLRSVWTFPTQPYPEAHFATYPEKLVEICVKAATPEVGCCSKCGKAWVRVIEKNPQNVRSHKLVKGKVKDAVDGNNPDMAVGGGFSRTGVQFEWQVQTLGWKPQCKCEADKIPSIVLDPFAGSGATLKVAAELNRRAIGYELSEQYCQLTVERNRQGVFV